MSDQLPGWLSAVVGVPYAIVAILQLFGFLRRRRARLSFRQLRAWGITRTRLDVFDDQP